MAKEAVKSVYDFLEKAGTYYLATAEADQPRVRPFGTVLLYEDRLYILTSKTKNVSKQIALNNKFELSAMTGEDWIRIAGTLEEDNREEVHNAMLNKYPHLKDSYTAGDENTNTLYIKDAKVTFASFTREPVELEL